MGLVMAIANEEQELNYAAFVERASDNAVASETELAVIENFDRRVAPQLRILPRLGCAGIAASESR